MICDLKSFTRLTRLTRFDVSRFAVDMIRVYSSQSKSRDGKRRLKWVVASEAYTLASACLATRTRWVVIQQLSDVVFRRFSVRNQSQI